MEQLRGYIERITYQNTENGYTVAQLRAPGRSNTICIVGSMPLLQPGETVRCLGEWKHHLVHGRQFEVSEIHSEAPADVLGITKYLGSGLIKGIGPKYAKKIVKAFGSDTLTVIDTAPERLLTIPGMGPKRVGQITACWEEQKSIRDVMVFLQSHGVSPAYAQKIFKRYGSTAIQKVTDNPYNLARDIFGIGFRIADEIAETLGIDKLSPQRVDAGIEYVMTRFSDEGHTCCPVEELVEKGQEILDVNMALLEERCQALAAEGRLVIEPLIQKDTEGPSRPFSWLRPLYLCEEGITRNLRRIGEAPGILRPIDTKKALEWVEKALHIDLAPSQRKAVVQAVTDKVHIITGGPGTGKSTITKAILAITEKLSKKIVLAAPTGRAAKRMTEITHRKAKTIHSLLEYDFTTRGFKRNRSSPLDCDLIVVDESSMIDTHLMYSLLRAIPSHARAIFVGDINQLPSVGPGNVLRDIISSDTVTVSMLTEIFRQARGSHIVINAHRINEGQFPSMKNRPKSDFFFIEREDNEAILETVVDLVAERLAKKYGYNPIEDIQLLSPMKKGLLGTENLNRILQKRINHSKISVDWQGYHYLIGDKVMQLRNNYQKEVFNGDLGTIESIDHTEQQLTIRYDNRSVPYRFNDLDEVSLAYATSIHKSQGSEFPCVVIPLTTSHFKLLHRNLLYTGVTRGKKLVVLVGTKKAVAIAVKNDEVKKRNTGLQQSLLRGEGKL